MYFTVFLYTGQTSFKYKGIITEDFKAPVFNISVGVCCRYYFEAIIIASDLNYVYGL